MHKYPRTSHVMGSRLQRGDHDLESVRFDDIKGRHLVVEEKMDGANVGISFEDGEMRLQSRGHFLRGGPRERHFDLFKQWAACHEEAFYFALGDRHVMYGEWMYAKHTCFYDALPHYFMEFDLYDKDRGVWASTQKRRSHYQESGVDQIIYPVRVITEGDEWSLEGLHGLIGMSHFKTKNWSLNLHRVSHEVGQDPDEVMKHTDPHDEMEGLYLKWEEGDVVLGRYKFVRETFTSSIMEQDTHWLKRTIVPNQLIPGSYEKMFVQV